jgi:hypothetical protein
MSDEWIGVVNSTKPAYQKGFDDLTVRSRPLLSILQKNGGIKRNCNGVENRWQVQYSQPNFQMYADGTLVDFPTLSLLQQPLNAWADYTSNSSLTFKQEQMNKGDAALVELFSQQNKWLETKAQNGLNYETFQTGGGAGRENALQGLESFLDKRTAPAATDRIAEPTQTYAGLSTALANQGGTWSSNATTYPNATLAKDWPDGQGSAEYDYWAPKLINYSSTNWGTNDTSWEANAWRDHFASVVWLQITGGSDAIPGLALVAANMYQAYKQGQEMTRRISVPANPMDDLGFKGQSLHQDGCVIMADFDCPYNTGYVLNTSSVELRLLTSTMFVMNGPDKDPRTNWSYLWGLRFLGQYCWQPKYVAKLYPYA